MESREVKNGTDENETLDRSEMMADTKTGMVDGFLLTIEDVRDDSGNLLNRLVMFGDSLRGAMARDARKTVKKVAKAQKTWLETNGYPEARLSTIGRGISIDCYPIPPCSC